MLFSVMTMSLTDWEISGWSSYYQLREIFKEVFVPLVILYKYSLFLKRCWRVLPHWIQTVETQERDPNKLEYVVHIYLNVYKLCDIKTKQGQPCLLT